ncbi:hypothetical protein [Clostridium sp. UBA3061]|uniref:hypothetical protein n=1 Tax=Clostridium sp. UBA3061 TaxID=1946353 RepID=UPI003216D39E
MQDIKFNLYRNENELSYKANEIINTFYSEENKKEQEKKKYELFHLLVLMDLKHFDRFIDYKEIRPNEPGDAIIIDKNNGKHLVEIFRVFGDEENKIINKKMNNVFSSSYDIEDYCNFDLDKMSKILLDKLFEKNSKGYLKDNQYKTKNILIVTCEHNRCSICGSWIVVKVAKKLENELSVKNYDNVYVVDYMASGKDGGPVVYDLENMISEAKKCKLIE